MTTDRQDDPTVGPRLAEPTTRRAVIGAAVLATAFAARTPAAAQSAPTPTAAAGEEADVALYFVSLAPNRLGPQLRPWRGTVTVDPTDRRVAAAALERLLAGPTDDAHAAGDVTAIPAGVRLLSAELADGGVVRFELSESFLTVDPDLERDLADRLATPAAGQNRPAAERVRRLRLAQVVFTLTQFETIAGVQLRAGGQPVSITDALGNAIDGPVTRDALEDVTPLILIERPLPLDTVGPAFTVSGSSNTFEGSLFLRLTTAEGDALQDLPVQATSGSGVRGTFSADLTVREGTPDGAVTLLGYELSARDGSEVNGFAVPLRFDPALGA